MPKRNHNGPADPRKKKRNKQKKNKPPTVIKSRTQRANDAAKKLREMLKQAIDSPGFDARELPRFNATVFNHKINNTSIKKYDSNVLKIIVQKLQCLKDSDGSSPPARPNNHGTSVNELQRLIIALQTAYLEREVVKAKAIKNTTSNTCRSSFSASNDVSMTIDNSFSQTQSPVTTRDVSYIDSFGMHTSAPTNIQHTSALNDIQHTSASNDIRHTSVSSTASRNDTYEQSSDDNSNSIRRGRSSSPVKSQRTRPTPQIASGGSSSSASSDLVLMSGSVASPASFINRDNNHTSRVSVNHKSAASSKNRRRTRHSHNTRSATKNTMFPRQAQSVDVLSETLVNAAVTQMLNEASSNSTSESVALSQIPEPVNPQTVVYMQPNLDKGHVFGVPESNADKQHQLDVHNSLNQVLTPQQIANHNLFGVIAVSENAADYKNVKLANHIKFDIFYETADAKHRRKPGRY